MATKRNLKKNIARVCADILGECIFAQQMIEGIDIDKMDDVIVKVALLQQSAIQRVSVDYDKTPSDFATKKEYNKARRDYFKQVEKALCQYTSQAIEDIVKDMNALLPQSYKDAHKQAQA